MLEETHQHPEKDGGVHVHISPPRTYWLIFALLIVLTIITVAVSYVHLGELNLVVAMVIATIKASFVVLYFMHMKYEAKFNALLFVGSIIFAGIFLIYTQNDTEYRVGVDPVGGARFDPETGNFAYGTALGVIEQAEQAQIRAARPATTAGDEADFGIWEQEPVRPELLGPAFPKAADPVSPPGDEPSEDEESPDDGSPSTEEAGGETDLGTADEGEEPRAPDAPSVRENVD